MLETKLRYIPESLAVVFLGAAIGLFMKLSSQNVGDWKVSLVCLCSFFFYTFSLIIYRRRKR